jgi:hypothetical protein
MEVPGDDHKSVAMDHLGLVAAVGMDLLPIFFELNIEGKI